jgi:ssDNA-binding Zn-finger/Zn-ribbon topoisomerase 1
MGSPRLRIGLPFSWGLSEKGDTMVRGRNQWNPIPWTAEEDFIVKNNAVKIAYSLLPNRTRSMVKNRRDKIGHDCPRPKPWTKREDSRIRKYAHEGLSKLARHFGESRTIGSVRSRRDSLGLKPRPSRPRWLASDLKKLQRCWNTATTAELEAMFPNRNYCTISQFAARNGLPQRWKKVPAEGNDLRDQVRNRVKEDGICIKRFSCEIGCGTYFCGAPLRPIHIDKIAKAVAFFGGSLVIDWQDE